MPYLLLLSNKHLNVFKENSSTYVHFKDQLHSHFFFFLDMFPTEQCDVFTGYWKSDNYRCGGLFHLFLIYAYSRQ